MKGDKKKKKMNKKEILQLVKQEGNEKDFKYKGYECRIRRDYSLGHLCGYIVIPKNHELFKVHYSDIEQKYDYELPTHQGLTFSDCVNGSYWIGFDCAHLGEVSPIYYYPFESSLGEEYRTMEYVETTLKNMIDFIIKENKK